MNKPPIFAIACAPDFIFYATSIITHKRPSAVLSEILNKLQDSAHFA